MSRVLGTKRPEINGFRGLYATTFERFVRALCTAEATKWIAYAIRLNDSPAFFGVVHRPRNSRRGTSIIVNPEQRSIRTTIVTRFYVYRVYSTTTAVVKRFLAVSFVANRCRRRLIVRGAIANTVSRRTTLADKRSRLSSPRYRFVGER